MRVVISLLVLVCTLLVAPALHAQDTPPAADDSAAQAEARDPADERAAQFVGVRGADAERIPGGTLLLIAYGIVWLLLFLFLLRLRGLQRQTAQELQELSARIQSSPGDH